MKYHSELNPHKRLSGRLLPMPNLSRWRYTEEVSRGGLHREILPRYHKGGC